MYRFSNVSDEKACRATINSAVGGIERLVKRRVRRPADQDSSTSPPLAKLIVFVRVETLMPNHALPFVFGSQTSQSDAPPIVNNFDNPEEYFELPDEADMLILKGMET